MISSAIVNFMPRKFSLASLWPSRKNSQSEMEHRPLPKSMADCFTVALLLRQLPLPPDIIPAILDYAEFHAYVLVEANARSFVVSQKNSGIVHTSTAIPDHVHRPSIRSVIFTTISHDQGWSWDTTNQGTYNASWTWFEVGILMRTSTPTLQDCRRIITNVHASKEEKEHRVEWFANDHDPYIQLIFRKLRAGESIGLNVCAMFPGWQNMVKYSSIAFTFQPVRKVP